MCGLCGVLSTTVSSHEFEKFKDILLISSFRGKHSTGVFSVNEEDKGKKKKHNLAILKQPISPGEFLAANEEILDNKIHTSGTVFVAGHCRHATRGLINSANAHPFHFPNLVGMHNGTLSENIGPKVEPKTYRVKNNKGKNVPITDTGTDSEAFFRYLNDHTIEETIAQLKDYSDAYAFVWYDKRTKTLNFLRNDRRPLWIASISKMTLYWASERNFLESVLNRGYSGNMTNNIDKIQEVPVDTLVSFDITAANPVTSCKVRKIEKPKRTYSYPSGSNTYYQGGYRSNSAEYYDEWGVEYNLNEEKKDTGQSFDHASGTRPLSPSIEERKTIWDDVKDNIKNREEEDKKLLSEMTFKILDQEYSRDEYERRLKKGCAFCSGQSDVTEKVHWMDKEAYLCETCKDEPDLQEYLKAKK